MNPEQLNQKAKQEYQNLIDHEHFDRLNLIALEMHNNKDPFDTAFYLKAQDELNYISGEIKNSYAELNGLLESYLAIRTLEIAKELSKNGEYKSGNDVIKLTSTLLGSMLKNCIRGEVNDLIEVVLKLETQISRTNDSLQSCRSHTYNKKQKEIE